MRRRRVSGQFQLGVERDEAQRKLAKAEQALEALRKEIDDLQKNSSAAHEEFLGKIKKEHGEATIALQAERDEIKSAFDALTTQSEELMKTIEVANERSGNAEKELGETKIKLQAKEKEFADLKSFYEENNASNLNEEERLKLGVDGNENDVGRSKRKNRAVRTRRENGIE